MTSMPLSAAAETTLSTALAADFIVGGMIPEELELRSVEEEEEQGAEVEKQEEEVDAMVELTMVVMAAGEVIVFEIAGFRTEDAVEVVVVLSR